MNPNFPHPGIPVFFQESQPSSRNSSSLSLLAHCQELGRPGLKVSEAGPKVVFRARAQNYPIPSRDSYPLTGKPGTPPYSLCLSPEGDESLQARSSSTVTFLTFSRFLTRDLRGIWQKGKPGQSKKGKPGRSKKGKPGPLWAGLREAWTTLGRVKGSLAV